MIVRVYGSTAAAGFGEEKSLLATEPLPTDHTQQQMGKGAVEGARSSLWELQ